MERLEEAEGFGEEKLEITDEIDITEYTTIKTELPQCEYSFGKGKQKHGG